MRMWQFRCIAMATTTSKMAAAEEGTSAVDSIVTEYTTYEHYLDSQINSTDLYYLEVSVIELYAG